MSAAFRDGLDGDSGVHVRLAVVEVKAEGHAAALDNIEQALREHAAADAAHQKELVGILKGMNDKADTRHEALTSWTWKVVLALALLGAGSPLLTEAIKAAIEHAAVAAP